MPRPKDLTDYPPFDRLTALRDVGKNRHGRLWECRCQCGTLIVVEARRLLSGNTRSCGCLHSDAARASAEIAREAKNKKCRQCGKRCREMYCSWQCGRDFRRELRLTIPCSICAKPIAVRPTGNRRIYCSQLCRQTGDNAKAAKRRVQRELVALTTTLEKRVIQ